LGLGKFSADHRRAIVVRGIIDNNNFVGNILDGCVYGIKTVP